MKVKADRAELFIKEVEGILGIPIRRMPRSVDNIESKTSKMRRIQLDTSQVPVINGSPMRLAEEIKSRILVAPQLTPIVGIYPSIDIMDATKTTPRQWLVPLAVAFDSP